MSAGQDKTIQTLKNHIICVSLVLLSDFALKYLLKFVLAQTIISGDFYRIVDTLLTYFCGIATVIFCLVATVTLTCNGWKVARDALSGVRRKR